MVLCLETNEFKLALRKNIDAKILESFMDVKIEGNELDSIFFYTTIFLQIHSHTCKYN